MVSANTFALGAAVLLATVAPSVQDCSPLQANIDYYGNDLTSTARASANDCCADCEATPGCKLFVYNGGRCWLKHTMGAQSVSFGAQSATMSPAGCSAFEEDTDYWGNDIKGVKRDSADECCADCKATSGCKLFVYNGGHCWLKNAQGVKSFSKGARASMVDQPVVPMGCSAFEEDTDYWGNDIKGIKRDSADECCADCKATAGCKLFVYNGGHCWLKSAQGAKSFSKGARASMVDQPVVPMGCSAFEEDTDYWGNDIKGIKRDSADECCADCKATSGCKLFVYNGGHCWLKNAQGAKSYSKGARASFVTGAPVTPAPMTSTPTPTTSTPAPTTSTPAPTTSTPAPTTSKPVVPVCPKRVRKVWENLSNVEQATYIEAIELSMDSGMYQRFMLIHQYIKSNREAHNTCVFLFWHRKFLMGFENMLRSLGPKYACITLPYLDYAAYHALQENRKCQSIEDCTPAAKGLGGSSSNRRSSTPVSGTANYPDLNCVEERPLNHFCEDPKDKSKTCAKCLPRGAWKSSKYSSDFSATKIQESLFGAENIGAVSSAIEMIPHNIFHGALDGPMGNPLVSPVDPIFYLHHTTIDMLHTIYFKCKVAPLNLSKADQQSSKYSFEGCVTNNNEQIEPMSKVQMASLVNGRPVDVDAPTSDTAAFFAGVPQSYYELVDVRNFGDNAYVYELNGLTGDMYTTCGQKNLKKKSKLESMPVADNATMDHIVNPVVSDVNKNELAYRAAIAAAATAQGLTEAEAVAETEKMQVMHHQFCLDDPIQDFTPEFKAMWHTQSPPAFVLIQSILDGSNPIRLQNWQAINEQFFGCRGDPK